LHVAARRGELTSGGHFLLPTTGRAQTRGRRAQGGERAAAPVGRRAGRRRRRRRASSRAQGLPARRAAARGHGEHLATARGREAGAGAAPFERGLRGEARRLAARR
jgi:hypothetical protein